MTLPTTPATLTAPEPPRLTPSVEAVKKHAPGAHKPEVTLPKPDPVVVTPPPEPKLQVPYRLGAIPPNSTLYLDNQAAPIGEGFAQLTLEAGSRHTLRCEPGPRCEGCKATTVRFTVPEKPTPGKTTKCDVRPVDGLKPE